MEIEVGDYVRDKDGEIHKIIEINNPNDELWTYYKFENNMGNYKETIIKHSKNIIDLVEVGDIVEIFDVLNEDVIYIWSEEMLKALKEDIKNGIGIRRILTHEQFEANCYKVKEEIC